jgi:DNA-binding LytR/AlgR family response regulator
LPDRWGLRIHRSHWVAARSVRALHRARDGWTLELADGQQLPVARARRDAVADWVARIQAR